VSSVHRLRHTDCIFFVSVNLRPRFRQFNECEYALLLSVLEASRRRLGFLLCGYVLMPDHRHALIWPQYPLLIEQVLHDAKKIMTLRLHARRGTEGPLWQQQYWDRFVRHAKEFAERLECMHLNPVKKGLVKRPEDWRWSSYNNFALDKETVAACPVQIDYVRLPLGYRA
jgi:REP element-mobilizing transposase RayT